MQVAPVEQVPEGSLLGASEIRELAHALNVVPTKKLGQNFVIDPNTVRRISAAAHLEATDVVVEIGPGLGSLTLALIPHVSAVVAVEVDDVLARHLPLTVAKHAAQWSENLKVVSADAMTVSELPIAPTKLVANLPYNISVPVVLHFLETFTTIQEILVMVQAEVAHRMAAAPGSKIYGIPSLKLAWYGQVASAGSVGRHVFWPAPNVDSGLVRLVKVDHPRGDDHLRRFVFALVDAAFGQRRKTLRSTLVGPLGSTERVEHVLNDAGISPGARGEQLALDDYIAIAMAAKALGVGV